LNPNYPFITILLNAQVETNKHNRNYQ